MIMVLNGVFKILSIFISVSIVNFYLVGAIILVVIALIIIMNLGSPVMSESQRLDSELRGPLHSMLVNAVEGLVTMRAFSVTDIFKSKYFFPKLEQTTNASFTFMLANRWLGLRMDLVCILFTSCSVILVIVFKNQIKTELLCYTL